MADNKFAAMLKTAREQGREAEDEQPIRDREVIATASPRKKPAPPPTTTGRGRPATGKRSNADYESTTVFLRRDTKRAAAKLLIDTEGQDLSDVLEKLLSSWVRKQS